MRYAVPGNFSEVSPLRNPLWTMLPMEEKASEIEKEYAHVLAGC
jgi:hypothetical protein